MVGVERRMKSKLDSRLRATRGLWDIALTALFAPGHARKTVGACESRLSRESSRSYATKDSLYNRQTEYFLGPHVHHFRVFAARGSAKNAKSAVCFRAGQPVK